MRIIDTHCHLIYRDRLRYPWLASVPALNRDFTLAKYLPQARPAGITDVVHMEVDVAEADMGAETEVVSGLGPDITAVVAACRPENADFPEYLEKVVQSRKVKGLRRVLHVQPDALARTTTFAEHVRRLAEYDLTFDLCVLSRQLPIAAELAARCPDVQFVLDHCGNPRIKEGELDSWRGHIRALAALPNVACKVSGIVTNADPASWTADDLRPVVEHVIACFGWDRVVWGSDWPVCTLAAHLGRWMEATGHLLAGVSEDERARLLGANAERIYRLGR